MTTAAVITAALDAARLPGAALERLSGEYAIDIMIRRVRRTVGVDLVACAIPHGEREDALAEAALDAGALVTRHAAGAALAGVAGAAREAGAQRVLHVAGIQVFFDPVIAGGVLALLADSGAQIATNAAPALFPDGLDCDAAAAALYAAQAPASPATRLMDAAPGARLANLRGPGGGLERLRWRLEHDADLAFARAIHAALGPQACTAGAAELAGLCLRRPDLVAINTALVDQTRFKNGDRGAQQTAPVSLLNAA